MTVVVVFWVSSERNSYFQLFPLLKSGSKDVYGDIIRITEKVINSNVVV